MAAVAQVAGEADDAAFFAATAQDYYKQWEDLAIDPSGKHTMLAYQWRSSWGLCKLSQKRTTVRPIPPPPK